MTDPFNGFAFAVDRRGGGQPTSVIDVPRPGINVDGGRPRRLLVVARGVHRAIEIARSKVLHATFVEAGPEILARARKLGIQENDAGIDSGQASSGL
jgi:hypothetical protein